MRRLIILAAILLCISFEKTLFSQWVQQPFPTNDNLWKVRFVDPVTGWIAGSNHIFKTTDGGISWIVQDTSYGYCQCLFALNQSLVIFANYGRPTRRSTDGGSTWQIVDADSFGCMDMEFVTPLIGYAVGDSTHPPYSGVVKKTTNGGSTWFTASTIDSSGLELEGISFVTTTECWTVSYMGKMYHTFDGGHSWVFQDSLGHGGWGSSVVPIRDVQFTTRDSGWAVGGIAGDNVIVRTTNGGITWMYNWPHGSSFREISLLNSQLGWVVGANDFEPFITRTTNGGETWVTQYPNPYTNLGFESISMVSENVGWVVGEHGKIYKTTNGGVVSVKLGPNALPVQFHLDQNYPNPFNPSTVIWYQIPEKSFVSLRAYDVLGRLVATLVNQVQDVGDYNVSFEAGNLPTGLYFYRLTAGNFANIRKMMVLK